MQEQITTEKREIINSRRLSQKKREIIVIEYHKKREKFNSYRLSRAGVPGYLTLLPLSRYYTYNTYPPKFDFL